MRLEPPQAAPPFSVETVENGTVTLERFAGKPLLLMFHRNAGCPMCNIRLHDFAQRSPAWHESGLEAVAFFHSSAKEIRKHAGGRKYPFIIAADPKLRAYRQYGVETSWLRLMMSFAWPCVYAEMARTMLEGFRGGKMLKQLAKMPADFFVGPGGRIPTAHYGQSISDHMSRREIEQAPSETELN